MELYLVQHGKAKAKEEDPDRSLSEEGALEVQRVAAFAAQQALVDVSDILHSGKTRARQTAEILADHVQPGGGVREVSGLAPNDSPLLWAEKVPEQSGNIMLVGHLPHFSKLAALLLCGNADCNAVGFVNAGIVCLDRGETGVWTLGWMITPRIAGL